MTTNPNPGSEEVREDAPEASQPAPAEHTPETASADTEERAADKAAAAGDARTESDLRGRASDLGEQAWLGTLPGNAWANVRRPVLHTLNLAHLLPLPPVWRLVPPRPHRAVV